MKIEASLGRDAKQKEGVISSTAAAPTPSSDLEPSVYIFWKFRYFASIMDLKRVLKIAGDVLCLGYLHRSWFKIADGIAYFGVVHLCRR